MKRYCPKCFSRYDRDLERCPDDNEKLVYISEDDLVGKTLDERYTIHSKLGEGGMGTVYVAEQAIIGRRVALKVLRGAMVQDESSVKRFLTEARAIATLKSPNTITLHDFGVTKEGQLYYTMEMLDGAPLSQVIKQEAPMDHARAGRLLLQACKSLDEAHRRGILHRDIKPDNIFITWGDDGEHVTVLDFGIAKLGEDSLTGTITKTGMLCGTPAYLSPEQAQGYAAVPASDLYALAIVYYEMLAGEPPFSDTTAMRVLMKQVHDIPAPVSVKNPDVEVPVSIESFILKGLAKDPAHRFQSVKEFRRALKEALENADACSDTTTMPSLATSADGLRIISVSTDGAIDGGDAIDPMAHTLDSQQAIQISTEPTEPSEAPPETALVRDPDPVPADTTADTAVVIERSRGPRRGLWVGMFVGILIAAVLGIWRPWEADPGAPPSRAGSVVPQERQTHTETADVVAAIPSPADVIPEPDPERELANVTAPAAVDVFASEDTVIASDDTVVAIADVLPESDPRRELANVTAPAEADITVSGEADVAPDDIVVATIDVVPDLNPSREHANVQSDPVPSREVASATASAEATEAAKKKRLAEERRKRRRASEKRAAEAAAKLVSVHKPSNRMSTGPSGLF